jgi:hypothetical protein
VAVGVGVALRRAGAGVAHDDVEADVRGGGVKDPEVLVHGTAVDHLEQQQTR